MFSKVSVANRGAIRAFRAAFELGAATDSVHRLKADESYQIGSPGDPVRAYLSVRSSCRRLAMPAPTRSIPSTGSFRRTRISPQPANRRDALSYTGDLSDPREDIYTLDY